MKKITITMILLILLTSAVLANDFDANLVSSECNQVVLNSSVDGLTKFTDANIKPEDALKKMKDNFSEIITDRIAKAKSDKDKTKIKKYEEEQASFENYLKLGAPTYNYANLASGESKVKLEMWINSSAYISTYSPEMLRNPTEIKRAYYLVLHFPLAVNNENQICKCYFLKKATAEKFDESQPYECIVSSK